MIMGKCIACGSRYYGWSLINPGLHYCAKCGSRLEIVLDEDRITNDHKLSVFEKYFLELPDDDGEEEHNKLDS